MFRNRLLPRALPLLLTACVALTPALSLGVDPEAPGAPDATHEAGHAEKAPRIFIEQTVWAIISFVVVLAILLKKLLPPIVKAMDKRAAGIREALLAAEKARAETREMMAQHEAQFEKARAEAAAIIEEGKADALKVKDGIVQSAKKEAEEISARMRREIEQAKTVAIGELDRRAVDLSIDIAAKLIGRSVNPAEHQDLIRQRVQGLPDA